MIEIQGTTVASSTEFNLNEIGSPTQSVPGQNLKGWPLRKILLFAQQKTNDAFDIDSFQDEVEISRPGGAGNYKVNQFQVADKSYDGKLPIYFLGADGQTSMWQPSGQIWTFAEYNPQVFIPNSSSTLKVSISPGGPLSLTAGDSQTFKATVGNAGSASVSLTWQVDGKVKKTGSLASTSQFSFRFSKKGSYEIAVFATATGKTENADAVSVTVDKAAEKPKEDKPASNQESDQTGGSPGGSTPGYNEPYDPGTSTGTPNASNGGSVNNRPAPREKPKKDQPKSEDDDLQTVSGELIDPGSIATVVPSTDNPEGSTEQAEPAGDSGLGGLPTGAKAAFGIGALLGIGGFAEAGAFTGAFRRFRYRL